MRKESDIMTVVDVCKKNGGIDVCINNAGLANNAPLLSGTTDQWREMMDVSVTVFSYLYSHKATK